MLITRAGPRSCCRRARSAGQQRDGQVKDPLTFVLPTTFPSNKTGRELQEEKRHQQGPKALCEEVCPASRSARESGRPATLGASAVGYVEMSPGIGRSRRASQAPRRRIRTGGALREGTITRAPACTRPPAIISPIASRAARDQRRLSRPSTGSLMFSRRSPPGASPGRLRGSGQAAVKSAMSLLASPRTRPPARSEGISSAFHKAALVQAARPSGAVRGDMPANKARGRLAAD